MKTPALGIEVTSLIPNTYWNEDTADSPALWKTRIDQRETPNLRSLTDKVIESLTSITDFVIMGSIWF